MPRCYSLIPSRINPHSLTDEQMMILDAMALEACPIIRNKLDQHHRRYEYFEIHSIKNKGVFGLALTATLEPIPIGQLVDT